MPARAALLASPRGDSRPPRLAVRAAAGRQARCGGPWGAKLAPAAHIFDVCVVYTVCTLAPVPSVPTREARLPVFAPCPDWLGGGSRLACNRSLSVTEHCHRWHRASFFQFCGFGRRFLLQGYSPGGGSQYSETRGAIDATATEGWGGEVTRRPSVSEFCGRQ